MAMNLNQYFGLRCVNTLEAVQNIDGFFGDALRKVQHEQLKELIQRQRDTIRAEIKNMKSIVDRLGGNTEIMRQVESGAEETVVVISRGWVGEVGTTFVEEHRVFVRRIPKYLSDLNIALLAEEITHFNLGNFTGLIVLAKQLNLQDIVGMLQEIIDRETAVRTELEGSLWQIVAALSENQPQTTTKERARKAA